MNQRVALTILALAPLCTGCGRHSVSSPALHAKAAGVALVESSGGKQLGTPGTQLPQPLIVQVNDKKNNGVAGALVSFSGPTGVVFDPAQVLTDSSGQAATQVTLGGISGRYELAASSADASGKPFAVTVVELAAGYQQRLGSELDKKYCSRCHDAESTVEKVSNYDNLAVKPHAFAEGGTFNKLSDADLIAIIGHGGPSLNRSALMPPFGVTLDKAETQALISYIRLVSDPPYRLPGVVYAKQ